MRNGWRAHRFEGLARRRRAARRRAAMCCTSAQARIAATAPKIMGTVILKQIIRATDSTSIDHSGGAHPGSATTTLTSPSVDANRWFGQPIALVKRLSDRKLHPQTTPPEVVAKVIDTALCSPVLGCCKLAEKLKRNSILISSPTVQKILIKQRLGTRHDRAVRLLEYARNGRVLSPIQILQVERILHIKL